MSKSLLQKAKEIKRNNSSRFVPDKEFEELTIAWCKDEVSLTQICRALGLDNTGYRVYAKLAVTLKKLYNGKKLM